MTTNLRETTPSELDARIADAAQYFTTELSVTSEPGHVSAADVRSKLLELTGGSRDSGDLAIALTQLETEFDTGLEEMVRATGLPATQSNHLKLTDYSQAERQELASKGQALADLSYPMKTVQDVHNAADLIRTHHGNWQAASRLLAKRCKELGCQNPLEDTAAATGHYVQINPRRRAYRPGDPGTMTLSNYQDGEPVMLTNYGEIDTTALNDDELEYLGMTRSGEFSTAWEPEAASEVDRYTMALTMSSPKEQLDYLRASGSGDYSVLQAGAEAAAILARNKNMLPQGKRQPNDSNPSTGQMVTSMRTDLAQVQRERVNRAAGSAPAGKFAPGTLVSQGDGNDQQGLASLDDATTYVQTEIERILAGYNARCGNRTYGSGSAPSFSIAPGPAPASPGNDN